MSGFRPFLYRFRRKGARAVSMPLRGRLAMLAAATVALAVAACALACWFLVRAQLLGSLDDSLRDNSVPPSTVVDRVQSGQCSRPDQPSPNPFGATVQVVDASGTSCVIVGNKLDVKDADVAVAKRDRGEVIHEAHSSNGTGYRVRTTPVGGTGLAVSLARPMTEIDESLRNLALILTLVGGAGVLGAAGAGVALARAGLRPVDRLTEAVEHIARTEDLAVRIPAEGDDEIARLSRSFNAMTEALASSRELQQQLIADAGHELRTPLTSLRTNVDLLVRSEETGRPLPEQDRRELMASVKTQMTELGELIGDIQELSRPQAGPAEQERAQIVGLHDSVERAVERVRPRGPRVTLTTELSPWYVRADPAALERSVVNLLDNAVKFSPTGGTVRVTLREGRLSVRDEGPGVPAEELPYVFDRFWRSPSARSMPGSGLGLSIVARTVRQAGGTVELRLPRDGGPGTEAALHLPGAPTAPPDLSGPEAPPGPSGPDVEPTKG
ncbi:MULTISPECIES: HAMP domain-containing sensor histidine kinase [unclassified Streptomyces]|uniref:HAMP domain-containing sensor histidine kinase n=2 Tax=Streptomyces TaxID=1883 RepID=UPI002DDB916D|nr:MULTISPECIES: HAMP domain-containing sensor histidine kinase [unclassified Streptomyces]WSA93894.1 HAMP domain-containing histidine kinase [Streptomyces sp. NBC_01795]WSS13480.1 HAMP domain-containing histidine kinase [Streptomyces sp. NBC_01186]WSS42278.1 HAMP domain-containing histidine kinase [Streptomyces sp. NBC_01187]